MAALSTMARGLTIGNGGISAFVSGVRRSNCGGGLFNYTTLRNFRRANTMNNYEGGSIGRYRYSSFWGGEFDDTTRAKVPLGVGNGYGRSLLFHDFIGDGYTTDSMGMNGNLRFITRDDFTDFEFLLREEALGKNYDEYYNEDRYETKDSFQVEDYEAKALGYNTEIANDFIPKTMRGDQYVVGNRLLLGTRHNVLEEYGRRFRTVATNLQNIVKKGIDRERQYETYSRIEPDKNHPFDRTSGVADGIRNRIFYGLDSLYVVAAEKLMEYDKMTVDGLTPHMPSFIKNKIEAETEARHPFSEKGEYGHSINLPEDFVTDVATKTGRWDFATDYDDGLYEYNDEEREKYRSEIKGIRYPSNFAIYSWENSYGVDFSQIGLQRYTREESKKYAALPSVINSDYTNGNLTTGQGKGRTYSYYQEAEGGTPITSVKSDAIADDSAVMIGRTFGNVSTSLLSKTNELFRTAKISSLINRFHTEKIDGNDELVTSFNETFGMSRGRNLLTKQAEETGRAVTSTGYENPYCRVWTAHHQYSRLRDRIRPFYNDGSPVSVSDLQRKYGVMRPNNGAERLANHTSLGLDGYPIITPNHDKRNIKNCMFSLENLAWKDTGGLSKEQRGPKGGRIMWFPPYNLKFTENVATQWNGNQFIGRGEQIYTYVNTERTGTLNFTILIDHPSILNMWRGTQENVEDKEKKQNDILRFFAGCDDLTSEIENVEDVADEEQPLDENRNINAAPTTDKKYIAYAVFFSNDFTGKDYFNLNNMSKAFDKVAEYETSMGADPITYRDKSYEKEIIDNNNLSLYNLNISPDAEIVKRIKETLLRAYGEDVELRFLKGENGLEHLEKEITGDKVFGENSNAVEIGQIDVRGFASSHGYKENNIELCKRRMTFIKNLVKYKNNAIEDKMFKELEGQIIQMHDADPNHRDVNTVEAKVARSAIAVFNIQWKNGNEASASVDGKGVFEGGTYKVSSGEAQTNNSGETPTNTVAGRGIVFGKGNNEEVKDPVVVVNREAVNSIPSLYFGIRDPNAIITPTGSVIKPSQTKSEVKPEDNKTAEEVAANSVSATTGSTTNDVSNAPINTPNSKTEKRELVQRTIVDNVEGYTADNEYLYFASVRKDKLIYQNIVDKVRYFEPAFHSITPEGFNARLTFLHQCTRQGPTVSVSSANSNSTDYLKYAGNLSFGRPPYCILRIGDFFHTKICIDSLSIDYDNGGGTQWDMNPEGVGLQPMFANVNINFKFIGGQDIGGAVEALQNAVSFNYYANASVYDKRATHYK